MSKRKSKYVKFADAQAAWFDINNHTPKPKPNVVITIWTDSHRPKSGRTEFKYNRGQHFIPFGTAVIRGNQLVMPVELASRLDLRFPDHGRRVA